MEKKGRLGKRRSFHQGKKRGGGPPSPFGKKRDPCLVNGEKRSDTKREICLKRRPAINKLSRGQFKKKRGGFQGRVGEPSSCWRKWTVPFTYEGEQETPEEELPSSSKKKKGFRQRRNNHRGINLFQRGELTVVRKRLLSDAERKGKVLLCAGDRERAGLCGKGS